jgi:DnaJ-class molecular chaperone
VLPITLQQLYNGVVPDVKLPDGRSKSIDIPGGSKDGTCFQKFGFRFRLQLDAPVFSRFESRGTADLYTYIPISIFELLTFPILTIPSIGDSEVQWTVDCRNDEFHILAQLWKRLKGLGLRKRGGERGDLYVHFDIVYPSQPPDAESQGWLKEIARRVSVGTSE